jgi:hypothetical protein
MRTGYVTVPAVIAATGKVLTWKQQPVYKQRKLRNDLIDQWVLCAPVDAMTDAQWRTTFGSIAEWPKGGIWMPVVTPRGVNADGIAVGGTAALDPGEVLDETVTWQAIGMIRQQRGKTRADLVREIEEAQAAREKK